MQRIVNKAGRAGGTHVDGGARSASTIFLDVFQTVSSRCMEKKHPHVSVDEKHRLLEDYQNFIVLFVLAFLQLQLCRSTVLFFENKSMCFCLEAPCLKQNNP